MENTEALQAIERGEKPDQDTLLRLNQAGLVDVADVTNMQSSGREYIFVGFTTEGLRRLKQSKGPLVTDSEREIILAVVRGFLDQHAATSSRALLKKFKSPVTSLLQRLGNQAVLQVANNTYLSETYLPKAIAFYHCGDSAALAFARKSTVTVLRVLHNLFDKELEGDGNDQKQFTSQEVETAARAIDSSVEPNMIFTGLYLAQEFGVFYTIRHDAQQVGVASFSLTERVYDASYMDWDEHIRRSSISLANTYEAIHDEPLVTSIPSGQILLDLETDTSQTDTPTRGRNMVNELNPAPTSFLSRAIEAVPAVRYALGVGGVIAVIAIVVSFKIDLKIAFFGAVIMFVLMTILLVFANLAGAATSSFRVPSLVFAWFCLVLFMATAMTFFSCVFFGKPLDLTKVLVGERIPKKQDPVPVTQNAPTLPPLVNETDVEWSDNAASGDCGNFGQWTSVCSRDKPEGWTIVSAVFELTGDRAGCAWAECAAVTQTPTQVCWHFRTQGHSEECGHSGNTGIHYSKGKLTIVWAHH